MAVRVANEIVTSRFLTKGLESYFSQVYLRCAAVTLLFVSHCLKSSSSQIATKKVAMNLIGFQYAKAHTSWCKILMLKAKSIEILNKMFMFLV